jgi:D-alanine-D-alanine ligase
MKILVLKGGSSNEREVSLRSAANIESALEAEGHEVISADPTDQGFNIEALVEGVDAVFPILHGKGGEDGALQADLEKLDVPFMGSRSEASSLTFDKIRYKQFLSENGVLTPNWQVVDVDTFEDAGLKEQSFVLKPIEGGSSIDTHIVHNPLHQALDFSEVLRRYDKMLLEELIEGQELTVGVLDDTALPVILIVPPVGEEFDYENKYNGKTQEIVNPEDVPQDIQDEAKAVALRIHQLTGCRHISRTDFILAPSGSLYVLETNTIPGLTEESLFPKAASAHGYDMKKLVSHFVKISLKK